MSNDKIKINPNFKQNQPPQKQVKVSKPNETGGVNFSSQIKIFDPNTGEVLVHKRGDM